MENQELIKKLESYTMNELNTYLLNHNDVEEDVFRHFADRVDWSSISCFKKLSENFIRDFADRVNWESISTNQELSEPFIREFADRVDWSRIPYNKKLSENFIREFVDKKELIMAGQFTIKETGIGTLYSCEKYSCFIRGTILSEVTINEDIEELYVPEGVTIFAPGFLNKKDCKVSRIILPSSLKKLDCTSFENVRPSTYRIV